jgi:import inner membrane translocase subunit TIM21
MAAIYKPTEAISLLRPSLLLPRIQPASARRARAAFSTSRPAQSTPSSTPPPPPPRRSITLTGDTGRVRWTELSPGEKVVRTTQQSFNLVVVAVGVIATVTTPHTHIHSQGTPTADSPRAQ